MEELTSYRISTEEFNILRNLIYDRFGISLSDQKQSMVAGRLQKVLRSQKIKNFSEYYKYITEDKTGKALTDFINHISTNHTYFNRENAHFDFFSKEILPRLTSFLRQKGNYDIRIWDSGCSSGEEAYMLIFLILDFFDEKYRYWDCGLLATDISQRVLDFAKEGLYTLDRVKKLPERFLKKYFIKTKDHRWQVKPMIRKEIIFRRLNLMSPAFPFKKKFHVIFCRNVMIYFDRTTRENIVRKFHDNLETNGFLIIGLSETLGRNNQWFQYVQPGIYRKQK